MLFSTLHFYCYSSLFVSLYAFLLHGSMLGFRNDYYKKGLSMSDPKEATKSLPEQRRLKATDDENMAKMVMEEML